jgi:hypothetical protein
MDWNYWLGRKYELLQQNAAADTTRANAGLISANAGANLDTVKAGLLPDQAAADIAQQREQTKYIGPLAQSTIGLQKRQGDYYGAQGGLANSEAAKNTILTQPSSYQDYLRQLGLGGFSRPGL